MQTVEAGIWTSNPTIINSQPARAPEPQRLIKRLVNVELTVNNILLVSFWWLLWLVSHTLVALSFDWSCYYFLSCRNYYPRPSFHFPNGATDITVKLWVGPGLHPCCESVPVLCCSRWQAHCVLYSYSRYAIHIGNIPSSIHNLIIFNYEAIVACLTVVVFWLATFTVTGT